MRLRAWAPVCAALMLASCANQPGTNVSSMAGERGRSAGAAWGIDLANDASDVLNELREKRPDFVARYYRDPASRWPTLSASEAQRLSSSDLPIVAIWESHSHRPAYFSYATGYADAAAAHSQARSIGQPAGSAIYFAVDFNAPTQAIASIDEYFRGVAAGLAEANSGSASYKVGVYGSGTVCAYVKQAGLATFSWLSNSRAWAGSLSYDDWNIKQGARSAALSFNHDSNEAKDEYGSFKVASQNVEAPYDSVSPPKP